MTNGKWNVYTQSDRDRIFKQRTALPASFLLTGISVIIKINK